MSKKNPDSSFTSNAFANTTISSQRSKSFLRFRLNFLITFGEWSIPFVVSIFANFSIIFHMVVFMWMGECLSSVPSLFHWPRLLLAKRASICFVLVCLLFFSSFFQFYFSRLSCLSFSCFFFVVAARSIRAVLYDFLYAAAFRFQRKNRLCC